ncbi:unnamed protein product [Polarella glacialis]|uniref:Uncharacterized protein n=1 Tax=Polarella glacialis TaxID=89957 RepID=A0A813JBB1_POLGL|nr:unnamed protein product [Polarella glacialis]
MRVRTPLGAPCAMHSLPAVVAVEQLPNLNTSSECRASITTVLKTASSDPSFLFKVSSKSQSAEAEVVSVAVVTIADATKQEAWPQKLQQRQKQKLIYTYPHTALAQMQAHVRAQSPKKGHVAMYVGSLGFLIAEITRGCSWQTAGTECLSPSVECELAKHSQLVIMKSASYLFAMHASIAACMSAALNASRRHSILFRARHSYWRSSMAAEFPPTDCM